MTIIASAALLVSATVWEGVTDVVSAGDLPGGSFSIATNSFPRNTIVDIMNLENGKMVRVKVVSGLETTGLLATLSRTAADSIDLRDNSTCRIRMSQPSDDIAFSHFRLGPIAPPLPPVFELDTSAENGISSAPVPPAEYSAAADNAPPAGNSAVTDNATAARSAAAADNASPAGNSTVTNNATAARSAAAADNAPSAGNSAVTDNAIVARSAAAADNASPAGNSAVTDNAIVAKEPVAAVTAATVTEIPPETRIASGKLSLLPAEERPPEEITRFVVAPDSAAYPPVYTSPSDFSPFPVPLISSLEPDKWYVQVGVYTHPDYVEDEINRIGMAYPLAIQNVGTDNSPMFRVLLGPLNQGESGAMLQRFKSIGYTDAFVRHN